VVTALGVSRLKITVLADTDADLIPQFLSPQPARDAMPLQQQQQQHL